MAETADRRPIHWRPLVVVLLSAAVVAALTPALDIYLAGDDFEWLAASYGLIDDPLASLEPINRFFRPLVKWTYLGNYLTSGTSGVGYIATSLAIHLINAALLFVLAGRRVRPVVAAGAAAAFAVSPLHSEAVLWAAGRPDTVLLVCWLAALLLLDRWCDRAGAGRAVAFTVVALLGAGAKESWIVFPVLAAGWVSLVRREAIASALRRTAVLWLAWAAYVLGFLIVPALRGAPGAAHYADFGIASAAIKTSHTLLGYIGLGWLPIDGWWAVALATLLFLAVAAVVRLTRDRLGWWALLWLTVTLALTAPFPLAVLRHNYLPLAGFWLLAAALADRALGEAGRRRRIAQAVVAMVGVAVLAVEAGAFQREISDYRRSGELHHRLVASLAAVEPKIPRDRPLVLIDRSTLRAVELLSTSVEGCAKTFFVRRDALWQLVFLPPLADFVGHPFDERLHPLTEGSLDLFADGCTVLLFTDRGFELRPDLVQPFLDTIRGSGAPPPGALVFRYEPV